MQVLASQLPFLANRNVELAIPPLFWPVNCIKIGGHVALLSGPTVYALYCANFVQLLKISILPEPQSMLVKSCFTNMQHAAICELHRARVLTVFVSLKRYNLCRSAAGAL